MVITCTVLNESRVALQFRLVDDYYYYILACVSRNNVSLERLSVAIFLFQSLANTITVIAPSCPKFPSLKCPGIRV